MNKNDYNKKAFIRFLKEYNVYSDYLRHENNKQNNFIMIWLRHYRKWIEILEYIRKNKKAID